MLKGFTQRIFNKNLNTINPLLNFQLKKNLITQNQKFDFLTKQKNSNFLYSHNNEINKFNKLQNSFSKKNFFKKIFKTKEEKEKQEKELEKSLIKTVPNSNFGQNFYKKLIEKLQAEKKFNESEKKLILEKLNNFNNAYEIKNEEIANKHYLQLFQEIENATSEKYKNLLEEIEDEEYNEKLEYSK